jgi:hypothetical protein
MLKGMKPEEHSGQKIKEALSKSRMGTVDKITWWK